jgi:hypothetical protein
LVERALSEPMGEKKTRKENEALERAFVQGQRDWWK